MRTFCIITSLALCGSLFFGCSSSAKQEVEVEEGLPVINLSDNVEEVLQLNLSDAAERVEIVKLETTSKSLLRGNDKFVVTENDIWGTDPLNCVLRFSRDGKFLNRVGKRGQGPEEYGMMATFFVDDKAKEVYIQGTSAGGIQVYDYEGNYIRKQTRLMQEDYYNGESSIYNPFFYYHGNYFLAQNLAIYKPIGNPVDSLWSVALVDDSFHYVKLFKNPDLVGWENEITLDKNRADPYGTTNRTPYQWRETAHEIDFFNDELTIMFSNTDTIYTYQADTQEFVPQYVISSDERRADFELMHQWPYQRERYGYFFLNGYYPTRDYIYLKGQKNGNVYIYQFDKNSRSVKLMKRNEDVVQYGRRTTYYALSDSSFKLTNDINGGIFKLDYRSEGKYWVNVLAPGSSDYDKYVADLRKSPDAPKKQELLNVIDNTDEEDNPILLIAILK